MAFNDISLTQGMRSNLTSLQDTVTLLNRTQDRLSTGKKVNTALDNPVNFFSSQALNNRASDLAGYKDGMSNAIQTIKAANQGITSITSLINSAKSLALSSVGKSASPANYQTEVLSLSGVTVGDVITVDGSSFTAVAAGTTASGTQFALGATDAATAMSLAGQINSTAARAKKIQATTVSGNAITLTASATDILASDVVQTTGTSFTETMLAAAKFQSEAVTLNGVKIGDVITVDGSSFTAVAAGTTASGTQFALGSSDSATATNLALQINSITSRAKGIQASSVTGNTISLSSATTNILTSDVTQSTGTSMTTALITGDTSERAQLAAQYKNMLSQITTLANDSSFQGINLINVQNPNALKVNFGNGNGITIAGFDSSSAGLGLGAVAYNGWAADGDEQTDVTKLDNALSTLRAQSTNLSNNLSIITTRQTFTTQMGLVLTTGSDNLTLADTNEEGANMLMLQTRQSLGTTALSLSAQAAQSVLKLFG